MTKYMKKTYSGSVLEIELFNGADSKAPKLKTNPEAIRTEQQRQEYNRRKSEKHFIRIVNTNFNHNAYYVTLTYNNDNLPDTYEQAQKNLDNYIRRLRRINPQAKIIGVTGYGRKGGRLHHHLIISGVAESDIIGKWCGGDIIRAETLRKNNIYNGKNHGEDFTALAAYLHAHTPNDVKGKRWKQTKTIVQPKEDKPKKITRCYSEYKPPKAPKGYELAEVQTSEYYGSGYICFKYIRTPQPILKINIFKQKAINSIAVNC